MTKKIDFRPVILAGGSGTRFWPRSRRARAKQVLALDGDRSMLQQTVERLSPIAGPQQVWVITNELLAAEIEAQLPGAQYCAGLRPGGVPGGEEQSRCGNRRFSVGSCDWGRAAFS